MNTTETDSKKTDIIGFFSCSTVPASFASKMERERDEARRSAEQWRAIAAKYTGCTEHECGRLPWEKPPPSIRGDREAFMSTKFQFAPIEIIFPKP